MKIILGLDLGTNSIGWSLVKRDFKNKEGHIWGMGSRIIPMDAEAMGKFEAGQTVSQTANRTFNRGVRRLFQRDTLRRERLHRVLHCLGCLPQHFSEQIDFEVRLGQFYPGKEPKIAYLQNEEGRYEFIFQTSYQEMLTEFQEKYPLRYPKGKKIPYDWTVYYLRKKALTEKLSPQEFAWIVLHFNQKRGYFQLRGEEEAEDEKKRVTYQKLRVLEVSEREHTGGKKWYDLKLENGWVYSSPVPQSEEVVGKLKEFIVTEELDEQGNILRTKEGKEKRSFRSVNSESDWIAIKKSTEAKLESYTGTVGEYIYENLLHQPDQKIKGHLVRTIERKFYKSELERILRKQVELQPQLFSQENYQKCIKELYPLNEAHRRSISNLDFVYLFKDDILFYQRPLKSKKSQISVCTLEKRNFLDQEGKRTEQGIRATPKSNPVFQEFRLLQWLKNLRIYQVDQDELQDITSSLLPDIKAYEAILEWLNQKTEISQLDLLRYPEFGLEEITRKQLISTTGKKKITKKELDHGLGKLFRWNYVQDRTYPLNETRGGLLIWLQKAGIPSDILDLETEKQLWHILYSVEDREEIRKALRKFASKKNLSDQFVEVFCKYPRIEKEYASYSEKAIRRLLSVMRFGRFWSWETIAPADRERIEKFITGEAEDSISIRSREKAVHLEKPEDFQNLPLWLASYILYGRHSEASDIRHWKKPEDITRIKQHSLRNPIVEMVLNETLQIVREIWLHYGQGQENFFDEIHIELGRDLKNPAKVRQTLQSRNLENQKTNARIKALLVELLNEGIPEVRPYSPMQQEILKIYEEGALSAETDPDTLAELATIRKKSSPSAAEIRRYRLWLDQKYCSPYTGNFIPLSKLFTHEYQIEHILPRSRYFDDSLTNKVICEAAVNDLKGNELAYNFIQNNSGSTIELGGGRKATVLSLSAYESLVKKVYAHHPKKRTMLLMKDVPEAFIQRQLNDTRYITRLVTQLLSNLVREKDEQEVNAKRLIITNGAITSRLKQDWGLNEVWNRLITPRFERLNQMAGYEKYGRWENLDGKKVFRIDSLEPELLKLNKKRIDHRHHALDALVVACTTREHVHYLNNLHASDEHKSGRMELRKNLRHSEAYLDREGRKKFKATEFIKPWADFTQQAAAYLDTLIVSFKQNNRTITRSTNYTWQWQQQPDGSIRKIRVKQQSPTHWSVRRQLHDATIAGKVDLKWAKADKGKIFTASRKAIDTSFNEKQIQKITDLNIQKILLNHLSSPAYQDQKIDGKKVSPQELAFSPEGLETMNSTIQTLNGGKPHKPIYKVRLYEPGIKFPLGERGAKQKMFVQTAKDTNLFFAVYQNETGRRSFSTIPFIEAIERLKQGEKPYPAYNEEGHKLLFCLSPGDLVIIPREEAGSIPPREDWKATDIYRFVRCTGTKAYFVPCYFANVIVDKFELYSQNKMEKSLEGQSIKMVCEKIHLSKLGI